MATDPATLRLDTSASNLATSTASDWFNPWPNTLPWTPYVAPSWTQPAVTYNVIRTPRCAWCQGTHTDKCPDIKSVTYRQDGTVERVEFFDRE